MFNKINFGDNAFDVIRLLAAIQVVIGHSIAHLQLGVSQSFVSVLEWFPGVVIFFSISGYLITSSADRSVSNTDYIRKRLFRIYPALLICFVINFIIVLVLYNYSFSFQELLLTIGLQTTLFQWFTPDFLRDYGVGSFNGALWTIIVELQFYFITLLFHKKMKGFSMSKWLMVIFVFVLINVSLPLVEGFLPPVIYGLIFNTFLPYLYIYLIGAFLYVFKDKLLPVLRKNVIYIIIGYVGWRLSNEFLNIHAIGEWYDITEGIMLPLITIGLAYSIGRIKLSADLSYGIYLYHMVVIGAFVQVGYMNTWYSMLSAWVLTLILAVFSWYVIEKRFIEIGKMKTIKSQRSKQQFAK